VPVQVFHERNSAAHAAVFGRSRGYKQVGERLLIQRNSAMILALYSAGVSAIDFLPGQVIHWRAELSWYWSWRRNHDMSPSFRPSGARSSHCHMFHRASSPREYAE
jgi:hypothetical protein